MSLLDSWTQGEHSFGGTSHPTYRKGIGPRRHRDPRDPRHDPGRDRVRRRGGRRRLHRRDAAPVRHPGAARAPATTLKTLRQVCVSNEFTKLATGVTTPVAGWLRSLARELHDELGGPGVGALGMCFTGGFALAMMVDTSVVAPVLAQPSAPFAVGRKRGADLNLSPSDLATVKERAAGGCQVLGLRYEEDLAVGSRFETLTREIGDAFIRVEFEGRQHATLTEHRQQEGVDRVLAFFDEKLHSVRSRWSRSEISPSAVPAGSPRTPGVLAPPGGRRSPPGCVRWRPSGLRRPAGQRRAARPRPVRSGAKPPTRSYAARVKPRLAPCTCGCPSCSRCRARQAATTSGARSADPGARRPRRGRALLGEAHAARSASAGAPTASASVHAIQTWSAAVTDGQRPGALDAAGPDVADDARVDRDARRPRDGSAARTGRSPRTCPGPR